MRHWTFAVAAAFLTAAPGQAQTFNIGANFTSMTSAETGFRPPDTQGSAGQNQVMILNNGRVKIFNKIGAVRIGRRNDVLLERRVFGQRWKPKRLWRRPHPLDPLSGRWFALNFTDGTDSQLSNNKLVLAISAGPDATSNSANWKSVVISPTQTGYLQDFPTIGIDENGIYIGTNNYQNIGGSNFNVSLYDVNEGALLWSGAGSPTLSLTRHEGLNYGTYGFAPVEYLFRRRPSPARRFESSATAGSPARSFGRSPSTKARPALARRPSLPASTPKTRPNAPGRAAQNLIATGDERIGSQSVQVGNFVYFANHFDNGTGRSQIRWTIINARTGATGQPREHHRPQFRNYYYPSLWVNEHGQAVLAFSGSNGSTFVNTYAAVSTTTSER